MVEGDYGIDAITHCCLEPHGTTLQWDGDRLKVYLSTQNVSRTDDGFAGALNLTADDVDVHCEYIGGGFGSKFQPNYWGIAAAEISKATGRPVKFMLNRDQELKIGGNRPSGFVQGQTGRRRKWRGPDLGLPSLGNQRDSTDRPSRSATFPYVFVPKNYRRKATGIVTNNEPSVAWRAPNHPQACAITQTAYDDLAAKMQADSLDIFLRNLQNIDSPGESAAVCGTAAHCGRLDQLAAATGILTARARAKVRSSKDWGSASINGAAPRTSSNCLLKIHPDGGVESYCGTQDLGTGTRTVCAMVSPKRLACPSKPSKSTSAVSTYPFSGASGGSTTVGAVSESHRRAAQDALAQIFELVAKKFEVPADQLEAADGKISVVGYSDKELTWKQACSLIGIKPLEVNSSYKRGERSPLVEFQTSVVARWPTSQSTPTPAWSRSSGWSRSRTWGLIINRKTAESQVYGALIMSIAAALFEQRINDPKTGALRQQPTG